MAQNLRLIDLQVVSSVALMAIFNANLNPALNTGNTRIACQIPGIPLPEVLQVNAVENTLFLITQPLTPYTSYNLILTSSSDTLFNSDDGQAYLLQDGQNNVFDFLGYEDPSDPIRDYLLNYLKDNVYNLNWRDLSRDIINSQAINLSQALYAIRAAKNDNYLSVTITDEQKFRGEGPFDRLNEEGCYEITRVGLTPTETLVSGTLNFDPFPFGPISLQTSVVTSEQLVAGRGGGTFNSLILNATQSPVSQLTQVTIQYQNGSRYLYNLEALGYQILDATYDPLASTLLSLTSQQFKLSDSVLSDPDFQLPGSQDTIIISYQFLNLGRSIDPASVQVNQILSVIRELTPPIVTQFTLQNFPIVITSSGVLATSAGVLFLDPQANPPFSALHPAFQTELPFKYNGLPSHPGEYAVDYTGGRVVVFGTTAAQEGTGNFPPTASYSYLSSFESRLDYTYDADSHQLVANPLRSLIGVSANINYNYQDTLIPGTDFLPQCHTEVLNERVGNKISSSGSVFTTHTPITDVFQVFNETSGEIYKVQTWSNNTVYFTSNVSPRILTATRERATFQNVTNETLFVASQTINENGVTVVTLPLVNHPIIAASEDCIGSSFNSSAHFSRVDLFQTELYYDDQTSNLINNLNRLNPGEYQIDYSQGLVYLGVLPGHSYDLGIINYKAPFIVTANENIIAVSQIYNSINNLLGINKTVDYSSFTASQVLPAQFDLSDERFLQAQTDQPYIVSSQTITVTDDIESLRTLVDHYDLTHNIFPVNFVDSCTFAANVITLASPGILKTETLIIQSGLTLSATFISAGINLDSIFNLVRLSDQQQLQGTISGPYTITLNSGSGFPAPGQAISASYYLKLNGAATPIVDYNRGDYYLDYTYLADQILVTYEHGDNCIDFRVGQALSSGQPYYVSYKVGALRDALLANFGSLVNLPILNSNFDLTFPRENYRDALTAALQSFTKGPTIPAMKLLVSSITHIEPELIESAFQLWSLGISHLTPQNFQYTGTPQLLPAKYDQGLLIDAPGEGITFPAVSNFRLEGGTLELWVLPEWNGLDNDATLIFSSLQKNALALNSENIWIGSTGYHPTFSTSNNFTVSRFDTLTSLGLPAAVYTQTGIFIYYDESNQAWKVLAKDTTTTSTTNTYSGSIISSGEVYNAKFIPGLGEIDDVLRSGSNKIDFVFNIDGLEQVQDGYDGYGDGYQPGYSFDGLQFMADDEHYLLDFGQATKNRFSLFKDGRGYLNFRIRDRGQPGNKINQYQISTDISSWTAGQKYHIATSWKLNTPDHADEIHLFLNGQEVPNILKYGGRPSASSTDRFRSVKPEIIAGTVTKNLVTNQDLHTQLNSTVVYSDSVNFSTSGIQVGDQITIAELGFGVYGILAIDASTLVLDTPMPAALSDARFSVNEFSVIVSSEFGLAGNLAVSLLSQGMETEIPGTRATNPGYNLSLNALGQTVLTLLGYAQVGDQVLIRTLGLNHRRCRDRQFIWGNFSNILKTRLPPPLNLDQVSIISILLPRTSIGSTNSIVIGNTYVATNIQTAQPSNTTQGRTLKIKIDGNNVNFSSPVSVTLHGTPTPQTLTFSTAESQITTHKFTQVTGVDVTVTPLIVGKNSISLEIMEAYPITTSEGNNSYPVIRYSYQVQSGTQLQLVSDNQVSDAYGYFLPSLAGQTLVISSPFSAIGTYIIDRVLDAQNLILHTSPGSFTSGTYIIYQTTLGRSGFANGFFTLQQAGTTNTPFLLSQGYYDFDYAASLEIPFDPVNGLAYLGTDIFQQHPARAILDELMISSQILTDVRIGETLPAGQESITTDYFRLLPLAARPQTLMLAHLDSLPLINSADFWVSATQDFRQTTDSVNSSFGQSLVMTAPLIIENQGYLTTSSGGTIEFWISPRHDTYNDPNYRFYFDAAANAVENATSLTTGSVQISGRAKTIDSVRLQTDTQNIGPNYFTGGQVQADGKTLLLGTPLPSQQTPVKISYIPTGLAGNRISLYKDREGYFNFTVISNTGLTYQIRQPIFWERDSWHRIKVTYEFNRRDNLDQLRLFIDGEEGGTILFGTGLLFGQGAVFGQGYAGLGYSNLITDINFNDPLNQFSLGADYLGGHLAQARMDNFKLSNAALPPNMIMGRALDINYNRNLTACFPVITDAFTTYLNNFDTILTKTNNLALVRDETYGIFNFILNIIDSFDIVSSNPNLKLVLETLIAALKPAQSKVTINYF